MGRQDLGKQLRALRAASGRTVAAVATDAGLSVPYVANLENGRGNPTVDVLDRLAAALDTRLTIGFVQGDGTSDQPPASDLPASLVRFSRGPRFRHDVRVLAEAAGHSPTELAGRLLGTMAGLADLTGRDLAEADWFRLLDAVLLVALHPNTRG
ncbi:helix-turn-helix domain-containing protein [Umezawaea endophytica]|uniref:Helix-turn-helix domain-containing protein n=1 Tax=Umezawaea endophytica TaxID=1654476 RepID=A0A9X2VF82_9PSEU|nr:helix-turn-helix transcriptional regulator [Umezawaea endophytica]MCS7475362.1 helix-turn-helix domain-containing protein [Umezawaea endophytica]